MRLHTIVTGAALALGIAGLPLLAPAPAQAIGCLTGGAAGAVAGHYAHHHAVLGAIGGCIAGHHMKVMQRRKAEAAMKNPAPAPTPTSTPQ